jgi:hypothetical protein
MHTFLVLPIINKVTSSNPVPVEARIRNDFRGIFLFYMKYIVFNVTFNNILVISWRSALLVEETGVPGKKTTDLSHYVVKTKKFP